MRGERVLPSGRCDVVGDSVAGSLRTTDKRGGCPVPPTAGRVASRRVALHRALDRGFVTMTARFSRLCAPSIAAQRALRPFLRFCW